MAIPINYRRSSEAGIAVYDFVDISEGTGVVIFYLGSAGTSAGITYNLNKNAFYSQNVSYYGGTATLNFNLTSFNMPRTLKGTAYLSCALFCQSLGGNCTVTARIQKISGIITTNCSSQIVSTTVNGNGVYQWLFIPIALTQTSFKKGDILRCEIVLTSALNNLDFGHDPMNRAGTSLPVNYTQSRLFLPFRIDL